MNRLGLEARPSSGGTHKLDRLGHVEVRELSAPRANGVIVTARLAIVAASAIAESEFKNHAGFFEMPKGVVNCGIANSRQEFPRFLKHFARCQVLLCFTNNLQHHFALFGQLNRARLSADG